MSRLVITSPDGKRGILEITKPVITIGRIMVNDLVLNDGSVSRFHAVVKQTTDGEISIADRDSTNGVKVNGKRIAAETPLHHGDKAEVGIYEITVESLDETGFVIREPQMPETLKQVLAKGGAAPITAAEPPPAAAAAEVLDYARRLERENYLLRMLYDAGRALNGKLSMDDIVEQVMTLVFRIAGVERAFLMFFDEQGQATRQTEVRHRNPPAGEQPKIILSRAILDRVKAELQPILVVDAADDERFAASASMRISGLRSAMCAPLAGAQRLFAILYVDNMAKAAAFTRDELNVFAVVASQAASAIDNLMSHRELAEQEVQRAALERFLAPQLVEMIAAHPEKVVKLGGQNQKVSVMFADIRGFTGIAEALPPERVVDLLNEYFTRVTDVIFGNGGTLDKYLGDGVMAVFGPPISKGGDADNAVRTAIEMQRLVQQLNRDAVSRGWPELRIGIGINTGVVTAGNIGSPRRIDYTVVGDAVNVAARLMAFARGGQVVI